MKISDRAGARSSRLALALGLAAVLAFVLAITIPFAGQPFHIDDAIYWDFARTDLAHPFQLHIPDYQLMGQDVPVFRDTHPPADQFYMAALMSVTGSDSETVLHLGFIVFPLMMGVSMFLLARRFTRNALLAALLLMATPTVMAMSHTLMGDTPMVALWLAATATYILGVDRDDARLLLLAGVLALLAVFTGYQALGLVLLLPLYALLNGRLSWKTVWPVALPLLGFGLYCLYSLHLYDDLPRLKHTGGLSTDSSQVLERLRGTLLMIGGASVFPLLLAAVFSLRRKRYLALPVIFAGCLLLALFDYRTAAQPVATTALFIVFLTAGVSATLAIGFETVLQVANLVRRRDVDRAYLFLGLWLLAVGVMVVVALPHATAKYTLPLLAPLVLLLLMEVETAVPARLARGLLIAAFALTCVSGVIVSAADYEMAASNQDFVQEFAAQFNPEPGGDVWFVGEWGFRHYMEARGYRYLTSTNDSPRDGDVVVRAEFSDWPLSPSVRSRMQLMQTVSMDWALPVRVMNFDADAGFYGTYWGNLPYAITSKPVERYEIFRIGT
ncbi:MAG: glycosyltransferase family 39 protein [Thermoleophilia bacterium]